MPRAAANGIELEYDTFGSPAHPALLLIMGLGTQMTAWDPRFCGKLAERGFHVIRFDNRDIGLSTQFDGLPEPDLVAILGGDRGCVPYMLADMADDAAGLLDTLEVDRAHVVGASMGGMIAQELAIRHGERVLSLCSIMSTSGNRDVGYPTQEAMAALMAPRGADREQAISRAVQVQRIIGSGAPQYAVSDEVRYERAAAAYDRAYRPDGGIRQLAAIAASPDRTEALGALKLPVLVMHGDQDPLVDVSGGRATAAAVPGAELRIFPGMGHDLPEPLWNEFVEAISRNAARAAR
ncbi:alpha/beta fold hydrolase [Actinocrinis puniceicyclus]|uniref:Alpha/beta fold hydrolase n=1 Tax=Actinocrinis puniceicyclus TaxID=977794 RepID=A0A8J8BA33_9ACTN|nr:alpha/beta hydrolase [Actinocrinis puniceicyclus]MBS2961658.1 alpha/beta fold hydrolase [Actinocrinis puniceicyclus]